MEKSASTARTFGLEMEEVVGHITSIGSVTMESGERIGNALKTIYARITTNKSAIDALEAVDVSINKISETGEVVVRDTGDILEELAGKWSGLSDAQRQATGVGIAGVNQLSRFLALMNNYSTAVEATTVAYSSQGSAMKEQQAYMDSYEAKINQVKTQFTEMALALGDAFLSDGIFILIEALGKAIETGTEFVETYGLLPPLFGAIGTAMVSLIGVDKIFGTIKSDIASVRTMFSNFGESIGEVARGWKDGINLVTANGTKAVGMFTKLSAGSKGVMSSFLTLGGSMLAGAGIIAGFVLLGVAIDKYIKKQREAKKQMEEWKQVSEQALDVYNNHGNDLSKLVDEYELLNRKMQENKESMSVDETRRYAELVNELQTALPQVVDHVDANGEAHLKSADAIRDEIGWVEKLAEEHQKLAEVEFAKNMRDNITAVEELGKKMAETREEIEKTKTAMEKGVTTRAGYGIGSSDGTDNNAKVTRRNPELDLAESEYRLIMQQYDMSKIIGTITTDIQKYSIEVLKTSGNLDNLSDSGKRAVENIVGSNKALLEGLKGEELQDMVDKMSVKTVEFGESINEMYGRLTEGLEGVELDELKGQLDSLVTAIPKEAFITDENLNTTSLDAYMSSIESLVDRIRSGDGDFKSMISTLESFGFSNIDATNFVAELGKSMENQSILSAIAKEELTEFNSELSDTVALAMEAIDPISSIFGFDKEALAGVNSYLDTLKILRANTEDYQNTAQGQMAIDKLADYWGLNERYIVDNLDQLMSYWDTMENLKFDENGVALFPEGTTQEAIDFVNRMLQAGATGGEGLVNNFRKEIGAINDITDDMVNEMDAMFKQLQENPEESMTAFLNLMKEHLDTLEGSFTLVNGKIQFADGSSSQYMDKLNEQLDKYGIKLSLGATETGEFFELLAQPPNEDSGKTISKVTDLAERGTFTLGKLQDVYHEYVNSSQDNDARDKYLDTVTTQLAILEEELVVAKDEKGNLEFAFASGNSSPWLEELRTQFDLLGVEITETTDSNGDLRHSFSIGGEEVFLDEILSKTIELSSRIGDAEGKVGTLKKGLAGIDDGPQRLHGTDVGSVSTGSTVVSGAVKDLEDMSKKIDEINTKTIEPDVSKKTSEDISAVVKNVSGAKVEIDGLNTKITGVKGAMDIAKTSMDNIISVGGTIETLATNASNLSAKLIDAKNQLTNLNQSSQNGAIDVTAFRLSVETIEGLVGRMKLSVQNIQAVYSQLMILTSGIGEGLNLTPIRDYQTGFSLHMLMIKSQVSSHMDVITEQFGRLRGVLSVSESNINQHEEATNKALSAMSSDYISFSNRAINSIVLLSTNMTNIYSRAVVTMEALSEDLKTRMIKHSVTTQTALQKNMETMGDAMIRSFRATVSSLAIEAGKIPSLVGKGITDNMNSSTSAITSLADNLVRNFKTALGIHSPSRVFEELGGFVMDGLVNGLSDGNLSSLGQKVFSEFGNGAFDTIDSIKGFLSADWAVANGSVKDWIASAVGIAGVPTSWIAPLMQIAQHESGGNPKAINNWDINAQNGIPSKGLMQTIDPTFKSNMMAGFGDIWNPVHNTLASIQYILKRYGSVWNVPGIKGLMNGTGYVGYGSDVRTEESSTESSSSALGGFIASSAFGGESLGGGIGSAVGNLVSTTANYSDAFTASATKNESKELEALFKVNSTQRDADVLSAMLRKANTEVKAMTENTLAYRNALKEVNKHEDAYMKKLKTQLSQQKSRHAQVAKEIKSLSNTSKHTESQRKRYNELQKEFESSLDTIYNLENEVRSMEITISGRAIEIFEDYITEIVGKYEKAIDSSNSKIDDIEFKLSVNDFKETDTLLDNMVLENQKLGHLLGQESTIRNQIADLNTAYQSAQSRYGKNSQQAQIAYQAMLQSEEDLEDAILNRLKQEQKIKDERKRVSDDSIKTLKDYYGKVQSITTDALEMEREELKKNHELKMSQYDEEIARINSIYDSKLESIDKEKEEAQYNEQLNAKNSERVDLMNKIAKASRDTSLEGKKQLSELQGQLATVNDEILNMQTERQEKLYKEAIEAQRKEQIEAIERQKETAEKENQVKVDAIELQIEQAKQAYGELVNDEVMWKDLSDKFMAGDTNPLLSMVDSMETQLAQMMSGNYSSIIPNFKELSDDIKKELASSNAMDLGNFALEMNETVEDIKDMVKFMREYSATSTGSVNYNNPSETTTGSGLKYTSSVDTYAPKQTAPAPAKPAEVKPQRQHTIVAGDTLWDLAQKFYGNPFKWTTIAQANKNPDPYKLQIGRKLIIPFKSGGYVGDWAGDEGKIAMLHKKELVLNAEQTEHILSSAKLMDSVMRMMPKFNAKQSTPQFATAGGQNITIENMELKFDKFKGTREDANNMVDTFITKLKKM